MQAPIETAVHFIVPYLIPPSANHYKERCFYIGKDGYRHAGYKLSKIAQAYREAVAIFAGGRTVAPLATSERRKVRYAVRIDVYLGHKARLDHDNAWKVGQDALMYAGVIHSDSCVDGELSRCVIHRDQRENPRTEYTVTRLEKTDAA
jgi:hypothetical protein